jgi:hypothetical protein
MKIILYLLLIISFNSFSQINGGQSIYNFIEVPASSRIAAFGGQQIAIFDKDVSSVFQNPSSLNQAMNNHLYLNNTFYFNGAKNLTASFAKKFNSKTNAALSIQNLAYGKFNVTDQNGYLKDTARANDFMVAASLSRPVSNKINYGISLKYVRSKYERFTGEAVLADVGFVFSDSTKGITIGIVMKNFGTTLNNFDAAYSEELPFDLQAGIAYRIIHTPFLFSLNLHHLHQFDIRYDDPALRQVNTLINDTTTKENKYIGDKILRHAIFGTEIYLGKVVRANVGFNYLRRKELSFEERKSLSGFSFGFQIVLQKFGLSYSYSLYNIASNSNNLSLYLNMNEFLPHKK